MWDALVVAAPSSVDGPTISTVLVSKVDGALAQSSPGAVTVDVCLVMPADSSNVSGAAAHFLLSVVSSASDYAVSSRGIFGDLDFDHAQLTLVQGPVHGSLAMYVTAQGEHDYRYVPAAGYVGVDQAVFDVLTADKESGRETRFRLIYRLNVTSERYDQYLGAVGQRLQQRYCPTVYWRPRRRD